MGKTIITAGAMAVLLGVWIIMTAISGQSFHSGQSIPPIQQIGNLLIGIGLVGGPVYLGARYGRNS
jgi:hypothetical protein